jgi:hypothetical protein
LLTPLTVGVSYLAPAVLTLSIGFQI